MRRVWRRQLCPRGAVWDVLSTNQTSRHDMTGLKDSIKWVTSHFIYLRIESRPCSLRSSACGSAFLKKEECVYHWLKLPKVYRSSHQPRSPNFLLWAPSYGNLFGNAQLEPSALSHQPNHHGFFVKTKPFFQVR